MTSYPPSLRAANLDPALEALELRDFNAPDVTPTQDADAFDHVDDEMTEAEIDRLYVAEMERRDRESAARRSADRFAHIGTWPDRTLIEAVALVDSGKAPGDDAHREAFLDAVTAELIRRIDRTAPAGARVAA
jgi:hypothetical protein